MPDGATMEMSVELSGAGGDAYYNWTSRFWKLALGKGFHHSVSDAWDADEFDGEGALMTKCPSSRKPRSISAIFDYGEAYVEAAFDSNSGSIRVNAVGLTTEAANAALDEVRLRAPKVTRDTPRTVDINFWYLSSQGGAAIRRNLHVAPWAEIETNYTAEAKQAMDRLLDPEWRPTSAGQLILWHGPPGTGKTTALRALGDAWKPWCEFHYITDPEDFFGGATHYMLQVLTGESDTDKWRLLILEDAGELMSADARVRSGAGLSRFLNAVDGLIGQGLRILILVTTNEEIGKLHPAVSRPGRCMAKMEFAPLSLVEADEWILRNGKGKHVSGPVPTMLAELYALGEESVIESTSERKVGFA